MRSSRTNQDRRDASFQRTVDLLLNSGGLNGRIEAPPAPERELAPQDHRRINSTNWHVLCVCGVNWQAHYDGWDGNRLGCEEAMRRNGVRP